MWRIITLTIDQMALTANAILGLPVITQTPIPAKMAAAISYGDVPPRSRPMGADTRASVSPLQNFIGNVIGHDQEDETVLRMNCQRFHLTFSLIQIKR